MRTWEITQAGSCDRRDNGKKGGYGSEAHLEIGLERG